MSISRRKKIQPAGTTLQAKDSLPIMDSNSRLVHFFDVLNELIAISNDDFRLEEILASMVIVSRTIPRKVACIGIGRACSEKIVQVV